MKVPFTITEVTQPALEPVTVQEAKDFMHVTHTREDALIQHFIKAARKRIEKYTGRALIERNLKAHSEIPLRCFFLPRSNVSGVIDFQYNYVDSAGEIQSRSLTAVDDYTINTPSVPAKIELTDDAWTLMASSFPYRAMNDLTITFTAGYGTAAAVPEDIKLAIFLLVGHWFNRRESHSLLDLKDVPLGFKWILDSYKVFL